MNRQIFDFFAQMEAFEGEDKADAPRATGTPVAIHGHQRLLSSSGLALAFTFLAFFGLADRLRSQSGRCCSLLRLWDFSSNLPGGGSLASL